MCCECRSISPKGRQITIALSVVNSKSGLGLCQARLLVDAQNVTSRVAKVGVDFVLVRFDRLDDFAAGSGDGLGRGCGIGDHNVYEQAGTRRGRTVKDPGATHLTDGVVEGG